MNSDTNKIIIRSVYKITRCLMEPAPDKHGRLAKSVRRVDSNGDLIYLESDRKSDDLQYLIGENETIEIFDGKEFDLTDPYDQNWWTAIKNSRRIVQERHERDATGKLKIDGNANRYGSAEFYVEYPGRAAKKKIERRRESNKATTYILEDSAQGLYTKVNLLGSKMDGMPIDDVTEYLLNIAEKTPEKIINLYEDEDVNYLILISDSISKGVITKSKGVHLYGEIILGVSSESVVTFMKLPKNKTVVDLIKAETYPALFDTPTLESIDDLDSEHVEEGVKAPATTRRGKSATK